MFVIAEPEPVAPTIRTPPPLHEHQRPHYHDRHPRRRAAAASSVCTDACAAGGGRRTLGTAAADRRVSAARHGQVRRPAAPRNARRPQSHRTLVAGAASRGGRSDQRPAHCAAHCEPSGLLRIGRPPPCLRGLARCCRQTRSHGAALCCGRTQAGRLRGTAYRYAVLPLSFLSSCYLRIRGPAPGQPARPST